MGRGPGTTTRNLVIFFKESVKQKKFEVYSNVLSTAEKILSENGTSSRCVLFIHKLSKHDHGAAEVQTSS